MQVRILSAAPSVFNAKKGKLMFGSKTLEGILAGFNKTITDLENFSNTSRNAAATKRADAETLTIEASRLDVDAGKAEKIRDNILSMLS